MGPGRIERLKNKNNNNTLEPQHGKILRLKQGYNPNSSSIGSIIFAVPTLILALPAIFGAAPAVILAALSESKDDKKADDK